MTSNRSNQVIVTTLIVIAKLDYTSCDGVCTPYGPEVTYFFVLEITQKRKSLLGHTSTPNPLCFLRVTNLDLKVHYSMGIRLICLLIP